MMSLTMMTFYASTSEPTNYNEVKLTQLTQVTNELQYQSITFVILLRHVRIAESEPYCHSILFVCLSVGHSATYSLPRLIDHNQIWSAGVSLFGSPVPILWVPEGKICKISPISNAYSCHCERDASCHMTCSTDSEFDRKSHVGDLYLTYGSQHLLLSIDSLDLKQWSKLSLTSEPLSSFIRVQSTVILVLHVDKLKNSPCNLTSLFNVVIGKGQFSTICDSETSQRISMKLRIYLTKSGYDHPCKSR